MSSWTIRTTCVGFAVAMAAWGHPASAAAADACPPGTPSAERFSGLPAQVAIGRTETFSLDFNADDWFVEGNIRVTMATADGVFFDDNTDDPLAEFWLHLDPGDTAVTVTATFEQITYGEGDVNSFTCLQTITRTVTGFRAPVRLFCNRWESSGENVPYTTMRPRHCSIWREHWAHYQSASFVKARWRSWGKPVARARATLTYNMGYRARVRVKAYRLRFDCTGRFRVYTRVAIVGTGRARRSPPGYVCVTWDLLRGQRPDVRRAWVIQQTAQTPAAFSGSPPRCERHSGPDGLDPPRSESSARRCGSSGSGHASRCHWSAASTRGSIRGRRVLATCSREIRTSDRRVDGASLSNILPAGTARRLPARGG
jgi:hypothetical protein